jgi:hypothetical protein
VPHTGTNWRPPTHPPERNERSRTRVARRRVRRVSMHAGAAAWASQQCRPRRCPPALAHVNPRSSGLGFPLAAAICQEDCSAYRHARSLPRRFHVTDRVRFRDRGLGSGARQRDPNTLVGDLCSNRSQPSSDVRIWPKFTVPSVSAFS